MHSQRHLFDLPEDVHYLNGAYMSPLMKPVQEAGMAGIKRKANPSALFAADYFKEAVVAKELFGRIVQCNPKQVAIIPSASYGIKAAVNNVPAGNGTHAITVSEEFPSGYYSVKEWCKKNGKTLKVVSAPASTFNRGKLWNENLLESINKDTSMVVISSIHWNDGTLFNLEQIGTRCREVGAIFIVDGTQSVGALPIDVLRCKIDALVCAAYKWLMAPYTIGLAYYSEYFDNGDPLEDVWLNKPGSEDFPNITQYKEGYREGAARYSMGEHSNFILLPMLIRALEQIHIWGIDAIQEYCVRLVQPLVQFLQEKNYWVEEPSCRASHLFGCLPPPAVDKQLKFQQLLEHKVFVSLRGGGFRVSPYLYNTENDIAALMEVLNK